jgi:hypothetical protein
MELTPRQRRQIAFAKPLHTNTASEVEKYPCYDPDAPAIRESLHFVTTLSDDFTPGLVCLLKSLNERSGVEYRFTVVTMEPISELHRQAAEAEHSIEWLDLQEIGTPPQLQTRMPRLAPNYAKLLMWNLPFDEDMFFIDVDTMCVDRLDQLLAWRQLTAVRNFVRGEYTRRVGAVYRATALPIWNSGVFCFHPDRDTHEAILEEASHYTKTLLGDQEILNNYWNIQRSEEVVYADYGYNYRTYLGVNTDVHIVHFAHDQKPWRDAPAKAHQVPSFKLWNDIMAGSANYDAFLALWRGEGVKKRSCCN